jgi:hypothetical protein
MYRDDVDLEKKLAVWEHFDNFDRPHGADGPETGPVADSPKAVLAWGFSSFVGSVGSSDSILPARVDHRLTHCCATLGNCRGATNFAFRTGPASGKRILVHAHGARKALDYWRSAVL